MTTIELSTSIPTATARPEREIMFSVTPEKYIITIANIMLTGILISVINVGLISRRNNSSIRTANNAPNPRLCPIAPIIRYI